ncbi:uncharacterized protein LOC125673622 [Ostrea edulis]|uniref:uncharacterized protein LOC125673622 n=1 Tax=Ostrea edulis TaxID=37623 RepID=UPI0024AFAD60|nr:uncharacterized protein LOC125673622 [Ostrea edulis]
MQNIGELVILILLSVCIQETRCLDRSCRWSNRTIQYVSDCPITKEDVDMAANIKGCEALARKQNCTDPSRFKYHCVINDQGNSLVEVCAPVYYIHGFCTEFNVQGLVIQPHFGIPCNNITPCADRYISTSAYLYPKCYDAIKKRTTLSLTNETTTSIYNTTDHVTADETEDPILYLLIPIVIVLLVVISVLFGWLYRRRQARKLQTNVTQHGSTAEGESTNLLQEKVKNNKEKIREVEIHHERRISEESLTDKSVAVAPGQTLKQMIQGTKEERHDLAKENEDITRTYIDSFRSFETYFVETEVFKECKTKLQKEGVVVLVGPPGCGKTTTAIGIMKDAFYEDWIKRKITSWIDFGFIDSERNSLIYIDNIFDGFMYQHELEKWWNMLTTTFYQNISHDENHGKDDNGFVSNTGGRIHLLITTKESVLPRAREYNIIRKSPVFKKDCIIFTGSFPLTDAEKDSIFDKQTDYAEKILDIPKPLIDPDFRRGMKSSVCHVGFPLCAHLYACEIGYRENGVDFFLYPINYLRKQIKYEIDTDTTHGVKMFLLLLFLRKCLSPSEECEERLDFRNFKKCREFLIKNLSEELVEQIEHSFSGDLEKAANTLNVMIVRQNESVYRFKHQIICDAVGFYFCTEWPEAVFKHFPIDAFAKHEFVNPTPDICDSFLSRVFDEVNNRNVSKALACVALKKDTFARRFCEILQSKKDVKQFFVATDVVSSYSLPPVFWISKYKHMRLSILLDELIKEKGIPVEHNFYLARFGECCANGENFLRKTDKNAFFSTTALQEAVLQYTDDNEISILHLIMMSERHDHNAFMITKKLIADFKSPEICKQIARDPCGQTVVNCAASEKRYSRILCILELYEGRKDPEHKLGSIEYSPIHKALEVVLKCSYSIHLELEMLIRLCLFIIYRVDPKRKAYNGETLRDVCRNTYWKNIHSLLCMKSPSQDRMSKLIEKLLTEIDMPHGNALDATITVPNPGTQLSKPLMKVITKYVYHFAKRELPA